MLHQTELDFNKIILQKTTFSAIVIVVYFYIQKELRHMLL